MGDLIVLADRFADRSRPTPRTPVAFFFDLACPFSYLAAERVERVLGGVEWIPSASLAPPDERMREAAEREARALRVPLVWPENWPTSLPRGLRAAAFASDLGRARAFALAASRLTFCGGFDLEDPEILAEAAAAAGLSPEDCLIAAEDPTWDAAPASTAQGLRRRGVDALPAVRIGKAWRSGPHAVAEAAGLMRAGAALAPTLAPSA
jgi:2-hydroxychromene-2-carboxylate isomerase